VFEAFVNFVYFSVSDGCDSEFYLIKMNTKWGTIVWDFFVI